MCSYTLTEQSIQVYTFVCTTFNVNNSTTFNEHSTIPCLSYELNEMHRERYMLA